MRIQPIGNFPALLLHHQVAMASARSNDHGRPGCLVFGREKYVDGRVVGDRNVAGKARVFCRNGGFRNLRCRHAFRAGSRARPKPDLFTACSSKQVKTAQENK